MAHKIPVVPSTLDAHGTDVFRCLTDVRKIHLCPLEEILQEGVEAECAKEADEILKRDLELELDSNTLERLFDKHKERLMSHMRNVVMHFPHNLRSRRQHPDAAQIDLEEREFSKKLESVANDPEKRKSMAKFFFCVDAYDRFSQSPWIKRAQIYRHVVQSNAAAESHQTSRTHKVWYITFPMILFFISFGFQSFMLHLATHFYIFYMDNEKGDNKRKAQGGQLLDIFGNLVAKYLTGDFDVSDEGAVYGGQPNIPLKLLDASAAVPLGFCVLAYGIALFRNTFNIGLWYKTFLVASLMAIIKGIADAVTILPDSTGWANCKARLTKTGLQSLRDLDFIQNFWGSIMAQLVQEVFGGGGENGGRVRYCADMMVSGHTYFACIFALSAYKQIAYNSDIVNTRANILIRNVVFVVCILCILTEIILVAAARFHYTVDMLASIVLVTLLFDSRYVEQLAADWSEGFRWRDASFIGHNSCMHRLLCKNPNRGSDLIASQSTVFNHRLVAGAPLWDEPDDDFSAYSSEVCREAQKKKTEKRAGVRGLAPYAPNEAQPILDKSGTV